MWPLARCISSMFVRTPSLQLGVLQSLQGSFHPCLILLSHLACSYLWWKPGRTRTSLSPSITWPKSGIREWTPLQEEHVRVHEDRDPNREGPAGQGPPFPPRAGFLKKRWEQKDKQGVQGYNCQKYGHIAKECFQKQKPQTPQPGPLTQVRKTHQEWNTLDLQQ